MSFIHNSSIETKSGENPLPSFDEFQTFVKDITSRCEEPPVASPIETVGQYRVFE